MLLLLFCWKTFFYALKTWGLHGSDLLQHVLQMLDQIGIWGIWRPCQHLGPFIGFLVGIVAMCFLMIIEWILQVRLQYRACVCVCVCVCV